MKLSNTTKKPKKEFNPIKHWYLLLFVIFSVLALVIGYSIYSFYYIKSQISLIDIESKNNAQNTGSADILEKSRNNSKILKDINNLNKTLEEFSKKETEYNRLIKSAVAAPTISTSTSSSTVATSTN